MFNSLVSSGEWVAQCRDNIMSAKQYKVARIMKWVDFFLGISATLKICSIPASYCFWKSFMVSYITKKIRFGYFDDC